MAASITVHLQIFKCQQLLRFSTDLDETGIKMHGLLRSFIQYIVIIRVAVPFNGDSKALAFVDNVKKLRQYLLGYTVGNSLISLIMSHLVGCLAALYGLQCSNLCLPRNSVVRITDCSNMASAVYCGHTCIAIN